MDVLSSSASEFVFLHSAQLAGSGLRRQKIKSGDTVCNGLHIGIIQIDEGDDRHPLVNEARELGEKPGNRPSVMCESLTSHRAEFPSPTRNHAGVQQEDTMKSNAVTTRQAKEFDRMGWCVV